jgi:5'(3')-deoxyribonucleotidase
MERFCFLDMDGVLVDFNRGIHELHGRDDVYKYRTSLGVFDIEKLWGISPDEFWAPMKEGFWRDLHPFPGGNEIVELLTQTFGVNNICILSSPSQDQWCIPEKRVWMDEHYPQLTRNMLFGSAKRFLAGPNRWLFDDRDKNIQAFEEAGGIGITIPRPWNSEYSEYLEGLTMSYLKEMVISNGL